MVLKEHGRKKYKNLKLVVDIQGDQPLIDPNAIDKTIGFMKKIKNLILFYECQ